MKPVGVLLNENRYYVQKIGSDLIAIIPLGIAVLTLYLAGQPYHRGFNCDDESIRYPYKDNTISSTALYFYSTSIPIITIIIVEFLYHKHDSRKYLETDGLTTGPQFYGLFLWQIYRQIAPFIFGALISQMTTDIAKYSIGRLRPHFIDLCQPRIDDGPGVGIIFRLDNPFDCHNYEFKYFDKYTCTSNYPDDRKRDSHLSFMSGHSSFSAFCLIYLVIYLQLRIRWTPIGFLRPLYQACLIYLVLYTGFSRISDYKHHWSDVFIGLIQGTTVAILTARYISELNPKRPSIDSTVIPLNGNGITDSVSSSKRNPNYNSCKVEMEESIGS